LTAVAVIYPGIIAAAALALLLRPGDGTSGSLGWRLIGAGLAAWALGDVYYLLAVDPEAGPYPSVADALYVTFYVLAVLGLRLIVKRSEVQPLELPALITATLGLATLWAWLVFSPVLGSAEGSSAAVATTLAYPFLDMLLLGCVLVALAATGWRPRGALLTLLAGFTLTAVADLIYSGQVAAGSVPENSLLDAVWPLGAVLIAASAWLPAPAPRLEPERGHTLVALSAAAAMLIALAVLVSDHFERATLTSVLFAALTLAAASAQLILLYRGAAILERQRRELRDLQTAAAAAALDCIVTVDASGRVREWNPAAVRTFGYDRQEAVGRPLRDLVVPPDGLESFDRAYERMVRGVDFAVLGKRVEKVARRADGSEFPVELAVSRIRSNPPVFTAFVRDISVSKKREEERERLAAMVRWTEDAMFSASLDGVVLAWNPAATTLYGYTAEEAIGTPLLDRIVPGEFEGQAQEMLRKVSRGEAVAFESVRRRKDGELLHVALRYFPIRDEMYRVTGCAVAGRDITDRRRREAEERRNLERRSWRAQIEEALETNAFEFHAQPVWKLSTRRIAHHELLLRMRMNDGIVLPGEFLPYAERSPLMRRIDGWAIRKGVALAQHGKVAINLSATSLAEAGIVGTVQDSMERHDVDPRNLIFEITETAAAENIEAARSLVGALTQMGCGFALDDFGTGYNSFTYLKHLPVTELKIDTEFIRGLAVETPDQQVVRSIVAVAENFGLTTVAEGVEDEATLQLLVDMGVDCAQGYLLGRPSSDWTTELDLSSS
jgi:PAS domain S-box-containing protein